MHNTIDATAEGKGPIKNYNQHMAIYYVVFVVIFTFMIINIYIALIILTFQRQGEKEIEGGLDRNQVGSTLPMQKNLGTRKVFTFAFLAQCWKIGSKFQDTRLKRISTEV